MFVWRGIAAGRRVRRVLRVSPEPEECVRVGEVLIERFPVTNTTFAPLPARSPAGRDPQLADHPVVLVTRDDALAFCAWLGGRLPTSGEWRGADGRAMAVGRRASTRRAALRRGGWGWTMPGPRAPGRRGACGAEQLAGNVWEWVADLDADGWRRPCAAAATSTTPRACAPARALPADPARATPTTGFRIAVRPREESKPEHPTASLIDALRDVYDPCCADRGVSIVDMGVVEDVRVAAGHVEVDLVPTTGWCPFVASMSAPSRSALRALDGRRDRRRARRVGARPGRRTGSPTRPARS